MAKNGNFILLFLQVIQADQLADGTPQQRHLMAKNGYFRFLLVQVIQADKLTDLPPGRDILQPRMAISDCYCFRSYRQVIWQIYPPPVEVSSGQHWPFQIADCYRSYRQINWQISPPVEASGGQHWQFHIAIVKAHIGIQWTTMVILDFYCNSSQRHINWQMYPQQRHLVAKNDNFRLLLLQVIQAD